MDDTSENKNIENVAPESGTVVVPQASSEKPVFIVTQTGSDTSILIGRLQVQVEALEFNTKKADTVINDLESRLESIEAIFDALQNIPKVGDVIKKVRDNKKLI